MGKHNENKLSLIWDKRQKDFVVKYPRASDGALIMNKIIGDQLNYTLDKDYPYNFNVENLKEDLKNRGYDLTTLKFSIELKK